MAAAAGTAAFLRSLATKVARSPPPRRLPTARRLHSGPGRSSPDPTSTPNSGSSRPPPSSHEELLQELMKEAPANWDWIKAESIRVAFNYASFLVSGAMLFHCWIMPKVDESLSRERKKMKDDIIQVIKQEFKIERIEGERRKAKNSEGQSMQISGHNKEHGERQVSDHLDEA
ncbi:unnamed protein product [Urochloa humidicola]